MTFGSRSRENQSN
ncbi:hypothetical protein F383_36315 [Gossypium arboreum]|uniref:Uncharacterized protein n=1 Tax=Gossypium arboreum TaxID=29729 RepID=A0A0B0NDY7_GOSAR|nr:hypothetical protein F383_36315 [Gossypium arboreum]